MGTVREVKAALPTNIPYYSFHGDRVSFNAVGFSTPGKTFLDPKDILVRVYNSTIASQAGFSGEVIAIGDYVDTVGVNEYVFGGGQPSLQQYITIRAEDVCIKSRNLSFADASRLHAGTLLLEHLRHLQPETMVLILGDLTGFGVQICRELGCFVTSSEDFGCDEHNIIDNDNLLEWLETHDFIFDVVVDASGDLDLYEHCHKFTTKRAEFISINPDTTLQALKCSYLPSMFGGGTRKLTVARPAKGSKKAQLSAELARKVLDGIFEVKNPRIVAYRSVSKVSPVERYVTAVNVIEQKDITPEDPEYNLRPEHTKQESIKDKGKVKAQSHRRTTPRERTPERHPRHHRATSSPSSARLFSNPTSPIMHPYSPKISSRLAHSISASNLPEAEVSPTEPNFARPAQPDFSKGRNSSGGSQGAVSQALSGNNAEISPLPRSSSPIQRISSPKIPLVSRPPTSGRQSSDVMHDSTPFEQIELQNMKRTKREENSSEESNESIVVRHVSRSYEDSDPSEVDSDTESQSQLLQRHRKTVLISPSPSRRQPSQSDEDNDVSDVDMNSGEQTNVELERAQAQIAALQKQVEALVASQQASASPKAEKESTQGLFQL